MRLLLTGASGFLGRNFLLRAPAEWELTAVYRNDTTFPPFASRAPARVETVRCDLSDPSDVSRLVEQHGREWDCCLHLAAKVDIAWSVREPREDLLANTGALLNLLRQIRADRFVFMSSGAVYDGLEGEVHPGLAVSPTLPYAISKLASEQYVQYQQRRGGTIERYLVLRFFGAYGPYEAPHKIFTRLVRALLLEKRDTYTIYGDGSNLIDAMYVDDAVEGLQKLLLGDRWNSVLDLAAGNPLTVESLVRRVAQALGRGSFRLEKEGVSHEAIHFWASVSRMREAYGFQPRVSLEQGIQRLADFLVERGAP
jgi:nucleoside-diphosphate-sugar epimerase